MGDSHWLNELLEQEEEEVPPSRWGVGGPGGGP